MNGGLMQTYSLAGFVFRLSELHLLVNGHMLYGIHTYLALGRLSLLNISAKLRHNHEFNLQLSCLSSAHLLSSTLLESRTNIGQSQLETYSILCFFWCIGGLEESAWSTLVGMAADLTFSSPFCKLWSYHSSPIRSWMICHSQILEILS